MLTINNLLADLHINLPNFLSPNAQKNQVTKLSRYTVDDVTRLTHFLWKNSNYCYKILPFYHLSIAKTNLTIAKKITACWEALGSLNDAVNMHLVYTEEISTYWNKAICLGLRLALLGLIASPISPNGGFDLPPATHPPPPPTSSLSHPPTSYNMPSVILQWFW